MSGAALLASFFSDAADGTGLPPYFSLGARPPEVGTAALDSSDQTVMTLDGFTGVGACRSGVNVVGPDQEVHRREVGEIVYVTAYPTAPTEQQLRVKLTIEQSMRLATGRRPLFSSLRSSPPMIPPRLIAAGLRVVEDFRRVQIFANSIYAVPGMSLLADGRLNAQNFPGATAADQQARLLRARGVRYIGIAKDGMLVSAVRSEARTIRRRLGARPFAFPILPRHLRLAYRDSGQQSASPKTLRHGSASSALGGTGAVRFALSLSGDHLAIVEFNLYELRAFAHLVWTGERLEAFVSRELGLTADQKGFPAIYSWHILPFVQQQDWETLVVPALEEIVFTAYTDTELGIYPRALADIHNHVKLRFSEPALELRRREIVVELARAGVPVEDIPILPDDPHKTDPDEVDALRP